MASVFLSYDREDLGRARLIAAALENAGHSVWWDRHIAGGAQYNREIERALAAADAVLVLWSERSVDSAWVRDEAAAGRDKGCLVPATIDGASPPLGFRQYQTIDLSKWKGTKRSAAIGTLLHAIDAVGCGAHPAQSSAASRKSSAMPTVSGRLLLIGIAALLLIGLSVFAWQRSSRKNSVPLVAVMASDSTSPSRSLARDLLIRLGSLQAARTDAFRLVDGDANRGAHPDLILEAAAGGDSAQIEANLALLAGKDRSVIWSKQFEQPRGKEAQLRQQLAVSAGGVLNCALQALRDTDARVSPQLLKLYLNGCAGFDELAYGELRRMIPVMRQVTSQAPRFDGAWAKLIQAEVLTTITGAGDPALVPQLRKDIVAARRANPHIAEAYLAEAELLPPTAYGERLRLTELAIRYNPEQPDAFAARAYYLRFVGRLAEGVDNTRRAAELNPLSPALRNDYITALSHAGEFERAKRELARAEQLWPGSSAIADARFRFNLRYGDPRLALLDEQQESTLWAPRVTKAFLRARATRDPADIEVAVREAQALARQEPKAMVVLIQVLGEFDRKEALLAILLDPRLSSSAQIREMLFRPMMRELWQDRRFMRVAKRLRLIDYWQDGGKWPDFCFEPGLPYDCKEVASTIGREQPSR